MVSIDVLPDDVLLQIFDFCMARDEDRSPPKTPLFRFVDMKKNIEAWQALVHVCRRWRSVVFGSPLRLNLALVCTAKTHARETLDIWPPLPLVLWTHGFYRIKSDECVDNIIAVLECSDRVCQIDLLDIPISYLEPIMAARAIQEPFPELTHLEVRSSEGTVIPDSFLGGSAPRLRYISLNGIPFPGLPNLLLSSTHLVHSTSEYSPFWVHFTRGDGHLSLRVGRPRTSLA
jgi:hypothetical protein